MLGSKEDGLSWSALYEQYANLDLKLGRSAEAADHASESLALAATEFAKRGGIVFVYFDDARLRFDVSLVNANKAQLRISSKVLGLARSVKADGPE